MFTDDLNPNLYENVSLAVAGTRVVEKLAA